MIALFYDTETTGLPLFNEPSEDPRQPHIVALAASLIDVETRATLASMDVIMRPADWEIPAEVATIHGITTERARALGVREGLALQLFLELWERSALRVAHNEQFDARIIRIALLRYVPGAAPDTWKVGRAECTQALATPLLKLPPTERMLAAGRHHYKSANLGEAYKHFTGQDLAGAHRAKADVEACAAVYFAIKGRLAA